MPYLRFWRTSAWGITGKLSPRVPFNNVDPIASTLNPKRAGQAGGASIVSASSNGKSGILQNSREQIQLPCRTVRSQGVRFYPFLPFPFEPFSTAHSNYHINTYCI